MLVHKKCDLFESGADILCHQVNCQGVMGSGVAEQVKERYPKVFEEYVDWCKEQKPEELLGKVQHIVLKMPWEDNPNGEPLGVLNIFGQLDYGYGKQHTDYKALKHAFTIINTYCREFCPYSPVLAFPYKFGCARGGGDWDTVYALMEECLTDVMVFICECDKG
jgi:O-acetyl-ADP-ribose deacetylase (regulator of RNase III)